MRSFLADRVVDVGQPSVAEKHALLVNAGLDRVGFTVPEWSKVLCDHRDIFRDALLQCRPYGGEVQYYVFLHGANAPRKEAMLWEVIPQDKLDGVDMAFEVHALGYRSAWKHNFRVALGCFKYTSDSIFEQPMTVAVMLDACFHSGRWVGSDCEWRPLNEVVQAFGVAVARANARDTAEQEPRPGRHILMENPWLLDLFGGSERAAVHGRALLYAGEGIEDGIAERRAVDVDVGPNEAEAGISGDADVFEEVRRRRDAWDAEHGVPVEIHFSVSLRGGAWTAAHVGEPVDSVRCQAASHKAREFCRLHGMPSSGTFSLRLYGEDVCGHMAAIWVHRMSFLLELEQALGHEHGGRLTREQLEVYTRLPVAEELLSRAVPAISRRVLGLLDMRPFYLR